MYCGSTYVQSTSDHQFSTYKIRISSQNLRAVVGDAKCVSGEGTSGINVFLLTNPDLYSPRAAGAFVSGGVGESDVITRNLLILRNCMAAVAAA